LIGIDHQEFLFTRLACRKATNELLESRHCLEVQGYRSRMLES
jgi:hypothetical protein